VNSKKKVLKVGGKINLFRRGLGLTLGEWSKKCRVPEGSMERICEQANDPTAKNFWKIVVHGGLNPRMIDEQDWGSEDL